ncbi:MAG: hypothetical protein QOK42_2643 [Frankiaceae bacterium]|nr:hypothetical protein [Frankiaceae bacterium]
MRHTRRVLGVLAALAVALPVSSSTAASTVTVGTASSYGLTKGFTLLGHEALGQRGMNSPLAVAGTCAYIGDRTYGRVRPQGGVAIVDVSNPRKPRRVGTIPAIANATQRELRADAGLGILVVMTYSGSTGAGATGGPSVNNLKTYDIRSCTKPKLLSTYDFGARSPHEFFLWKDRAHPGRALAYVTFTIYSPDLEVVDLADPAAPKLVGVYDLVADQAVKTIDFADESGSGYAHSISVSGDGTKAYLSGWDYGTYVLDTSLLASPPGGAPVGVARPAGIGRIDYGHDVHSVVVAPDGKVAVMGQEDYANAGHGCPFGWLRTADVSDPNAPKQLGEFKLPENDPTTCGKKNGTFSAHNQTVFPHVTLLTWYAGGLRAVDITKPAAMKETGAFVPRPGFTPDLRDERLFFSKTASTPLLPTDTPRGSSKQEKWTGAMWSYPVIQNGLVYVVDIDLGLYILRYTGAHHDEVDKAGFVEGNSSPARYSTKDPVVKRPGLAWAAIDREVAAGSRVVQSPYRTAELRKGDRRYGFICL